MDMDTCARSVTSDSSPRIRLDVRALHTQAKDRFERVGIATCHLDRGVLECLIVATSRSIENPVGYCIAVGRRHQDEDDRRAGRVQRAQRWWIENACRTAPSTWRSVPPAPWTASGHSNDALVFTGPKNAPLRRSGFSRSWWRPALEKACLGALGSTSLSGAELSSSTTPTPPNSSVCGSHHRRAVSALGGAVLPSLRRRQPAMEAGWSGSRRTGRSRRRSRCTALPDTWKSTPSTMSRTPIIGSRSASPISDRRATQ